MKHLGYVDRVSGYVPCRAGVTCMSHRNRELVVPVPDEGHLWQPSYSVHVSVEILFVYFNSFFLLLFYFNLRKQQSTAYRPVDFFALDHITVYIYSTHTMYA